MTLSSSMPVRDVQGQVVTAVAVFWEVEQESKRGD
jgi:hypothetical protein